MAVVPSNVGSAAFIKGLLVAVQFLVVPKPVELATQGYASRDAKLWVQRVKFPPKLNPVLPPTAN